ncbi:MAG: hypothetical protein ABI847_16845 [Anaerolineales bacterium]
MAKQVEEVISRIWCDRINQEAVLLEERIYPADMLPDVAVPFQVRARGCAFEQECRTVGFPCRWTGLNPNYDPF